MRAGPGAGAAASIEQSTSTRRSASSTLTGLANNVTDEDLGHERQPDGAVDASGFQVVNALRADRRTFRRDIAPAGVHHHCEQVFAGGQVVSDLVAEGKIAAQVLAAANGR